MKKTLCLMLLGLAGFATAAHADGIPSGQPVDVAICRGVSSFADSGTQLRVRYLPGPMGIAGAMPGNLVAQVARSTIAGLQPVGQYSVVRHNPVSVAQPMVVFEGNGFTLEVIADPRAGVQGGLRAHLVAEANRARIAEDMLCQLR